MSIRKLLIETICILAGLSVAIWYLGILLRPTDTDSCIDTINAFHNATDDSFDVICYGSSHGWRGLSTPRLNKDLGICSYNYGTNFQQLNTEKLFIEDSLRTQHPKIAIIETYRVNQVINSQPMDGEIYYTRAISSFPGKREYLRQCLGDDIINHIAYYVPFAAFHENWMNITKESFWRPDNSGVFEKTCGFCPISEIIPVHIPADACTSQKELSDEALDCLESIVRICDENDIKIIFYTTPYAEVYEYSKAMSDFAKEHNCTYINLFEKIEEAGIDENTDFSDEGHLNTAGAEKVAVYLEKYITELL